MKQIKQAFDLVLPVLLVFSLTVALLFVAVPVIAAIDWWVSFWGLK